ncbi:tail fiber assembly protein [Pseudomonas mediterranea]|uniref:phage tail assembly chaperone n=1 Tax=Pseudomonas mediterranea TaxID=183795 RepID=UPI001D4CF929|nr:phage tail assembly chaperone [Pseudomonas mediterranea]UZE02210.1 phage tail assembly chaperone [Pseudomonas mediterranea]CAH0275837.1 hypothetical protein SRABI112_03774 [Pseudomonas mediterranea]
MSFQLTIDPDTVIRLHDNTTIPRHHRYWTEYEDWLEKGGTPFPAVEERGDLKERGWRDSQLHNVQWLRERHRDEVELGLSSTLTDEQFKELLIYMQSLRNWPQDAHFPQVQWRPSAPQWIAEQVLPNH